MHHSVSKVDTCHMKNIQQIDHEYKCNVHILFIHLICLPHQDPRFDLEDDQSLKIRSVLCVPIKNHGGEVTFISRGIFVCFYMLLT